MSNYDDAARVRSLVLAVDQYRGPLSYFHDASPNVSWPELMALVDAFRAKTTEYADLRALAVSVVTQREHYRYLGNRPIPATENALDALAEFLSVENGFVAEMDALRDHLGIAKATAP